MILILAGILVFLCFFAFYFLKSSKEMPKNLTELKYELIFQADGCKGIIHDIVLRRKNKIGLFKQSGRLAVITGGNRGIGLYVVEKLIDCDITVVMGVRNIEKSRKSVNVLIPESKSKGLLFFEQLDVGNMASVRSFAKIVQEKYKKIDLLINNAGVMASPYKETSDGFESQMAINYLGHFLLTHLLLPQLKAAGTEEHNARIVNVSSCVHLSGEINYDDFHSKKFYHGAYAYNNSKLAQVLFTKHLQDLLTKDNAHLQVHSCHPGVVDTELFEHTSSVYVPWFKKLLFKNAEEGSRTIIYAAISPKLEGKGGSYLSNCYFARTSTLTKDKESCEKLFRFTCDMLKIKEFGKLD